jgi:hypothetical protein
MQLKMNNSLDGSILKYLSITITRDNLQRLSNILLQEVEKILNRKSIRLSKEDLTIKIDEIQTSEFGGRILFSINLQENNNPTPCFVSYTVFTYENFGHLLEIKGKQKDLDLIGLETHWRQIAQKWLNNLLPNIQEWWRRCLEDPDSKYTFSRNEIRAITLGKDLSEKLINLDLSVRALNLCKKHDIETLLDLAQRDKKELLSIKGFGKSVVNELEGVLDKKKLSLGMDLRRLIS